MGSLEGVVLNCFNDFTFLFYSIFFKILQVDFKFSLQLPDILNYEHISKKVGCKTHQRNKESLSKYWFILTITCT